MFGPITAIFARLRRLAARREGNVAILFGLSAIPVIVGAGIAIDAARAYTVKMELSAALDASALAVGSSSGLTSAQLQTRLQNYFNANFPNTAVPTSDLSVSMTDPTQPQITVTASATVPMTILQLVGINTIQVQASNQVTKGTNALELSLVLDNTGSMMCGDGFTGTGSPCPTPGHIDALKTDAQSIVDTLFADSVDTSKLKIAVVPYVTSVNIGAALCSGSQTCNYIAHDCSGDFVTDNGNTIYNPSTAITPLTFTGTTNRRSSTISNVSPTPSSQLVGLPIAGVGIPSGATVTGVTSTSITISSRPTSSQSGATLSITGFLAYWSAGSSTVTIVYPPVPSAYTTGVVAVGTGIGVANPNGNIHYAPATSGSVTGNTLTLCTQTTQGAGSSSNPVVVNLYPPVVYDMTNNPTTGNWKGCVVEPTTSGEDLANPPYGPDIAEPGVSPITTGAQGWTQATMGNLWWAFYWTNGTSSSFSASDNTWYVPGANPSQQIVYEEIDGNVIGATDSSYGPNLSCPTPLVRLTNSQSTLDAAMQSMTAWDNSGTAITVGMIWGWRTLSPNPPFGDAQQYGTPNLIKAVVLETDGNAEVAGDTQGDTTDFTGYGYISEGNLGATTAGLYPPYGTPNNNPPTANYYLQQRLNDVCANMKSAGIVIYTIGLGIGATNTQLENCAGPTGKGKFFPAPTSADLQSAFQQIAISLNSLRLTQ
jgi:Flp pilus assembly protein TadG